MTQFNRFPEVTAAIARRFGVIWTSVPSAPSFGASCEEEEEELEEELEGEDKEYGDVKEWLRTISPTNALAMLKLDGPAMRALIKADEFN